MIEPTEKERAEISERIAAGFDTAAIDLIEELVGWLREAGLDVPPMADLCGTVIRGSGHDPAITYALAEHVYGVKDHLRKRREAYAMMLSDVRNHSAKPE